MRAHSTGQNSTSGRSAITMPPEWIPRCRGKSSTWPASSSASLGIAGGRVDERSALVARCYLPVVRERLIGQLTEGLGAGGPAVDPLAERVGLPRRDARGLRHLPQRGTRAVRDHVGHLRSPIAPVAFVDVLDHLLAPLVLDVEVDVGWPVAFGGEEALEQQTERDRVGLGDAERVAHRAVGGAASTLAVDVVDAAELHDVDQHEEVAGEPELLDHIELVGDLVHGLLVLRMRARVAHRRAAHRELAQPAHLGVPGWDVVVGELRRREPQVERARTRDVDRALHRARPTGETAVLLGRAAQVREGRGRKPAVDLVERAARPYRGERGRERPLRRCRVMDVVGGDDVDAGSRRDLGQAVVAVAVDRVAVVPELDQHALAPERGHETVEGAARRRRAVAHERAGDVALAAAGEHVPRVVGRARRRMEVHGRARGVGQGVDVRTRRALLPRELCGTDRRRQPRVPDRTFGEHDQVLTGRVGLGLACAVHAEGELGAEHSGKVVLAGGEREAHDAVEAVVIGDRERGEPEARRLRRQLLGVTGAVEEGEIGVAVELGVRHGRSPDRTGSRA